MTDSLVELSYHTKFTKGINIMDQLNSTTFTQIGKEVST